MDSDGASKLGELPLESGRIGAILAGIARLEPVVFFFGNKDNLAEQDKGFAMSSA